MKKIKNDKFVFYCDTEFEVWRAETMFTKEPGTIEWLKREVKPGDSFWDVGANIGLYSIFAASLGAQVLAFEPHLPNAVSLMRNIYANRLGERVQVMTAPLGEYRETQDFNYHSTIPGSSGSQLGRCTSEVPGEVFIPQAVELKYAINGDRLCHDRNLYPTLLKIDVDGLECRVLYGMTFIFARRPLRSVQVEIHPDSDGPIRDFMATNGFNQGYRHDTMQGKKKVDAGEDPVKVPHNLVFDRGVEVT